MTKQQLKYQKILNSINDKREDNETLVPVNISYCNKSVIIATAYSLIELDLGSDFEKATSITKGDREGCDIFEL